MELWKCSASSKKGNWVYLTNKWDGYIFREDEYYDTISKNERKPLGINVAYVCAAFSNGICCYFLFWSECAMAGVGGVGDMHVEPCVDDAADAWRLEWIFQLTKTGDGPGEKTGGRMSLMDFEKYKTHLTVGMFILITLLMLVVMHPTWFGLWIHNWIPAC